MQIWVDLLTGHQHGISAIVTQSSIHEETSGGVAIIIIIVINTIIIIITIIIIFIITSIIVINFINIKIIIFIIIISFNITNINAYQELTFTVVKHEPPECYITVSQAVHQFWNVIQHILFSESSFFKVIHHLRIM